MCQIWRRCMHVYILQLSLALCIYDACICSCRRLWVWRGLNVGAWEWSGKLLSIIIADTAPHAHGGMLSCKSVTDLEHLCVALCCLTKQHLMLFHAYWVYHKARRSYWPVTKQWTSPHVDGWYIVKSIQRHACLPRRVPEEAPQKISQLIQRCMMPEPQDRPNMREIISILSTDWCLNHLMIMPCHFAAKLVRFTLLKYSWNACSCENVSCITSRHVCHAHACGVHTWVRERLLLYVTWVLPAEIFCCSGKTSCVSEATNFVSA